MDATEARLPIGRSGRLDALALTSADGDHALLVRDAEQPRALLSGRADDGDVERLVVTGIGAPVETTSDTDALAGWLASAPLSAARTRASVPIWANLVGLVTLLLLVAFAVIGGAVSVGWLLEVAGW